MSTAHRRHRSQRRRRYSAQRIRRIEGIILLTLALSAVALLTLLPSGDSVIRRVCLVCGPHAGADMILNVMLFVPIGAALALLGTPWRHALLIGFGITALVELLQFALPIGRIASPSDLVMNVAGVALGFQLMRRRRTILYPRSGAAMRFAAAGAAAWLLIVGFTAVALRPSLPATAYYGQLSPDLEAFDNHTGRVVSATLAGITVPEGPFANAEALRAAMRARMQLDAQVEFVGAYGDVAPVVRIVDEREREIALLAQRGEDLLFRTRVLGTDLRFVTPGVMLFDPLITITVAESRRVFVDAERIDGTLRLSAYGREAALPLHSGVGWMLLVPPTTVLHHRPDLVSAIWVGLPLIAVGYWLGRRARRKARRAGDAFRMTGTAGQVVYAIPPIVALIVIGLGGFSLALGLALPGLTVWAGAFIATGVGTLAGISSALTHDDRAHGTTRMPAGGSASADAVRVESGEWSVESDQARSGPRRS